MSDGHSDLVDFAETDECRPNATIIAWPLDRDVGRVRHVARLASKRAGKTRQSYWNAVCTRLGRMLLRNGLSEEQARDQLERFAGAVSTEISRLT